MSQPAVRASVANSLLESHPVQTRHEPTERVGPGARISASAGTSTAIALRIVCRFSEGKTADWRSRDFRKPSRWERTPKRLARSVAPRLPAALSA